MKEIIINVDSESDLYSTFGGVGDLSEEFKDFVIDKLKDTDLLEPVQFIFVSQEAVDEQRVRDSISTWIQDEKHDIQREEHTNRLRQLWMLIIGVVFVALSIVVEVLVGEISFTVLSTIGAFALWEAANVWIVENPHLRHRRHLVKHMSNNYTIIFKTINGES